ncbi:MAG: hypothetical protein MJ056_05650 [Akkermansia sp.]|nr:hypothetical protein [Akkermansia sp.]MDO4953942.1 hypothetical protein [Akkermansia sp.]
MIKNAIATVFAAVVMVAPAFADSAEVAKFSQLMDRQIAALTELCKAVAPVTDKATAEAAVPQVQAALDEIKAVEEESKAIGQPSAEVEQALSDKVKQSGQEEAIAQGLAKIAVLMMMDPACYGCKELETALSTIVSIGPGPQDGAPQQPAI